MIRGALTKLKVPWTCRNMWFPSLASPVYGVLLGKVSVCQKGFSTLSMGYGGMRRHVATRASNWVASGRPLLGQPGFSAFETLKGPKKTAKTARVLLSGEGDAVGRVLLGCSASRNPQQSLNPPTRTEARHHRSENGDCRFVMSTAFSSRWQPW